VERRKTKTTHEQGTNAAPMSRPSPRALEKYATTHLPLKTYFTRAGDGRLLPRIPAKAIVWSMIVCVILRKSTFLAIERTVRSTSLQSLPIPRRFSDDTLHYFSERVDVEATRAALIAVLEWAKRGKAFDRSCHVGLSIDGFTGGHSVKRCCQKCRPVRDKEGRLVGYHHNAAAISVVHTSITLPFDSEPYGPGDSEYAAGARLLERALQALGKRFAQYVVVDAGFATATFLHAARKAGIPIVARLKDNLPTLYEAARKRFEAQKQRQDFWCDGELVEIWDADNFQPWETLHWSTIRVLRYRQTKSDGTVVEAYWLTDLPRSRVGSLTLYKMCKSRWEIENQGFNDAKNRYGLKHIRHHEENSILYCCLMTFLAMVIERLYRHRYLHRGNHPVMPAVDLCNWLWLHLLPRTRHDSS
jgi:hypothetical protein